MQLLHRRSVSLKVQMNLFRISLSLVPLRKLRKMGKRFL
jgi:hypothetical protein